MSDLDKAYEAKLDAGCLPIGDCMVVPPGGKRTVNACPYQEDGVEKAIDGQGNVYLVTYEDEDPIFTIQPKPLTRQDVAPNGPLSGAHYVAYEGLKCPECFSEKITFSGPTSGHRGEMTLHRTADCRACGSYWTEVYLLSGYEKFVVMKKADPDCPDCLAGINGSDGSPCHCKTG